MVEVSRKRAMAAEGDPGILEGMSAIIGHL
jgi:hypothetical protein